MTRRVRIGVRALGLVLVVAGVLGVLGLLPFAPRVEPPPASPPDSASSGPDGTIVMRRIVYDGGGVAWLALVAVGVGLFFLARPRVPVTRTRRSVTE